MAELISNGYIVQTQSVDGSRFVSQWMIGAAQMASLNMPIPSKVVFFLLFTLMLLKSFLISLSLFHLLSFKTLEQYKNLSADEKERLVEYRKRCYKIAEK